MEVKNGIVIDGVLHEGIVMKYANCDGCSLMTICNEMRGDDALCAIIDCDKFVNRGKVTEIKIDKEEQIMTEELVTLETAKLLRKKGFNEYCRFVIGEDRVISDITSAWNLPPNSFPAPTQSIAQKWLRETKNLHIVMSYTHECSWMYDIQTIPGYDLVGLSDRHLLYYKSYKEALEAGIQEALKLI